MLLTVLLTIVGCANANKLADDGSGFTKGKTLHVMDAYQPERPGFMSMNAGYLKIESLSGEDVYIVDVSSPDYQSVSIHRSFQVDGVHKMEHVDSLKIGAGDALSLEPGGMHLMLHGPLKHKKAGDFTTINFALGDGENLMFKLAVTNP
ncbi:MAG: copper(I)-binding protein [Oleiphilaceae bacterium]|jgi:copper(I)-binding protein